MTLLGKTALITGAARRIGRETALTLAEHGADIIAHYRSSADEARSLIAELAEMGRRSWMVSADFEDLGETESLIHRAIDEAGSLDILVNNASIFPADDLETVTFESITLNMKVNAWAPFVLSKEFRRLAGRGKIVNILDSRIEDYDLAHVGYIISKHAFAEFARMTALAYAPEIQVNAVAPGLILPPAGKDESYLDALKETVPLKKYGDPQDVADAVAYLVSSDFITGQVIFVDGGRHLVGSNQ